MKIAELLPLIVNPYTIRLGFPIFKVDLVLPDNVLILRIPYQGTSVLTFCPFIKCWILEQCYMKRTIGHVQRTNI